MVVVNLLTNRRKQAPCRSTARRKGAEMAGILEACTRAIRFGESEAWQKSNGADLGSGALRRQPDDPTLRPGFQGRGPGFELQQVGQAPGQIEELGLDVLEVRQQDDHEAAVRLPIDDVADPLLAARVPHLAVPV